MNEEIGIQETGMELVDNNWGGEEIDLSDACDDEPDQPKEEGETEQVPGGAEDDFNADETSVESEDDMAEPEKQREADQSLELKYMGQTLSVTKEEAKNLAQKGMDYDRMRSKNEELLREQQQISGTLSDLSELARMKGTTVNELLDQISATIIAKKENIDPATALERARLNRREKTLNLRERQSLSDPAVKAATKRAEDIKSFVEEFPHVKPETIPKEVWTSVSQGAPLTAAYVRYENSKLRLQLEAQRKNTENKALSAGSRSTGSQMDKEDPYDRYWNED